MNNLQAKGFVMTSDQIIKELGIEGSDKAFQSKMITGVLETANIRFARVVDEVMNDEERREFDEFAKDKDPQDVVRWVEEKYEGIGQVYDEIVNAIVADLKHKSFKG
jgi:succinate dehydrogenase flavin-adding protein (antitoxin of CptAB toxin-antitoxin module)